MSVTARLVVSTDNVAGVASKDRRKQPEIARHDCAPILLSAA